jgi:nitrate reductase NapAB chaperone NapD
MDQQYLLYICVLQLTLSLMLGVSTACIAKAGVVVVVQITKASRAVVQRLERCENLLMIIFVVPVFK